MFGDQKISEKDYIYLNESIVSEEKKNLEKKYLSDNVEVIAYNDKNHGQYKKDRISFDDVIVPTKSKFDMDSKEKGYTDPGNENIQESVDYMLIIKDKKLENLENINELRAQKEELERQKAKEGKKDEGTALEKIKSLTEKIKSFFSKGK